MKFVKQLLFLISAFISGNTYAQWVPITDTIGTNYYGNMAVTVTNNGSTNSIGNCPGVYWIQYSGENFSFDFSAPVAGIRLQVSALEVNETLSVNINGVPYVITSNNLEPNPITGNCFHGNCNINSGQLVHNSAFQHCGGILTFYGSITNFKVIQTAGYNGTTFDVSFLGGGQGSYLDSFHTYVQKDCAGPVFTITRGSHIPGSEIHSYFGDGTSSVTTLQSMYGGSYAAISHTYSAAGVYGVKHVLFDGLSPVDSFLVGFDHIFCSTMPVYLYHDANTDCSFDVGLDNYSFLPVTVEVDSVNIPIDTISCTSGFTYTAYGNAGAIYKFKILSLPGDVVSTCPVTGVIFDTLQSGINSPKYIGLGCSNQSAFDLSISADLMTAANRLDADIVIANTYCVPQNAVLTMTYSPKYTYDHSSKQPFAQTANTVSWNLDGLEAFMLQPTYLHVRLNYNGQILTPGDTVQTVFTLTPTIGDVNIVNNIVIRHDTVTGPYDPNAVYVSPDGCVEPGKALQYSITFENMGNAPAQDIYILDTLSSGLDMNSFKLIGASHLMHVEKMANNGFNVLKFEFKGINLPDSSSPDRHGMVRYTIDMDANSTIGSIITNKAGIFFDYMPPVLTNVAMTEACLTLNISNIDPSGTNIFIYPNPATDELTIKTEEQYHSYSISNSLGQRMQYAVLSSKETRVNIKSLPPGLYYLNLEGEGGTEVRKFVKM